MPREADANGPSGEDRSCAAWWELRRERQNEIDASIARNADVEYLYDRPLKAKGVVRVAGPFTVESLSPHRVLPLEEDPYLAELLEAGDAPRPVRRERAARTLTRSGEGQGSRRTSPKSSTKTLTPPACRTPRRARRSNSNG